jgi:uncharacterized protein YndB with AHSA1/START domain
VTNDPTATIERDVGRRHIGAGEARSAILRRRYDAPIEDVWDACTNPDRLRRWFLPVSGELQTGGTFQIEGNAGGEILRCEPPHRLSVTWVYGDRPTDEVELRLASGADGDTLLVLEHATVADTVEWEGQEYDALFGVGTGWELPLDLALPAHLRGELDEAPPPEFLTSPEVKEAEGRAIEAWSRVITAARSGT